MILLTLALTRLKLRAFNYSYADGAIHANRDYLGNPLG
jgi:hypothetical protein